MNPWKDTRPEHGDCVRRNGGGATLAVYRSKHPHTPDGRCGWSNSRWLALPPDVDAEEPKPAGVDPERVRDDLNAILSLFGMSSNSHSLDMTMVIHREVKSVLSLVDDLRDERDALARLAKASL
jgi:hypothetical protein